MPIEQAQGVALRCVAEVGGQNPQVDDALNTVGIPDPLAVQALTREIVHGDGGVRQDGFTMRTADFSSIKPSSIVDDVAEIIHKKAEPRKRR
jgi:hypothetical protein